MRRFEVVLRKRDHLKIQKTRLPCPSTVNSLKETNNTRDVPNNSAFANRRGKTLKSTARMARHVITIIPPRYAVTNGLWFEGALTLGVVTIGLSSFPCFRSDSTTLTFGSGEKGGCRYSTKAGVRRRIFRRIECEEYVVIEKRRHIEFNAVSRKNAGRP